MSRDQQRAQQQQALGAFLASQTQSITEETVGRFYHELSNHYNCRGCGVAETKKKKHLLCSRCNTTRYCSKECQISHWKEHKCICKLGASSNNANSGSIATPGDSKERMELYAEKYRPMLQLATYWELKLSAEDMILIFELEELPAECKAPRLGIKSFRQESSRSAPDSFQEFRTNYLIHTPPSMRKEFALLCLIPANGAGRTTANEFHITKFAFSFQRDDEDSGVFQAEGRGCLPRDIQIGIFHQEASKYVKTVNDMARGGEKNLSKAAKPRRG
jgi:hypothetical protein